MPASTTAMSILVIILSPVLWLLRLAVLLLFAAPGLAIVGALALGRVYRSRFSRYFGRDVMQFPSLFWPYCNFEDGIDGLRGGDPAQKWWAERTAKWTQAKRVFIWSAFRNPVDSLRWLPIINPKIAPARVRYVGSMDREPQDGECGWYFAWQGLYSCIRWEFELRGRFFRLWLGWKLKPEDSKGLHEGDVRAIRCDFAAQFKRVA